MTSRVGPIARARRIAADDQARVRAEIERGRLAAGLSIADLGRAVGLSRSATSRALAGRRPMSVEDFAVLGAAVGLDTRLRAYPAGDPIRDAASQRLLERLRVRLHPGLGWRTEVPLPIEGDFRAWDALITGRGWRCAVEAETVLDDLQALERRLALKRRDGGIDQVILLVSDTRRNRRALAAAPAGFASAVLTPRAALAALGEGRDPGASALILL